MKRFRLMSPPMTQVVSPLELRRDKQFDILWMLVISIPLQRANDSVKTWHACMGNIISWDERQRKTAQVLFTPNFWMQCFSLQGLDEYRSKLAQVHREHSNLQSSLNEWRYRFRAEQRNLLLLVGMKYAAVLFLLLAGSFVVLGKAANFLFFALVVLYFVIRSEETNRVSWKP